MPSHSSLFLLLAIAVGITAFIANSVNPTEIVSHLQRRITGCPIRKTYCYTGGVYTLDDANSTAKCFSVDHHNKFSRVFTPTEKEAAKFEWREGTALPGFWDGHGHIVQYGEMLDSVQLYGASSLEDARDRIKAYVKEHPDTGTKENWIKGVGWDQANFGGEMPTAEDISSDPELADLYIMLDRVDVHCTWVSTPVLSLLPDELPDVPGGHIPTEGVFCDNAMTYPLSVYPAPTLDQRAAQIAAAQKSLHEVGIVGAHDAGVTQEIRELYNVMADKGALTLRVYAMHECKMRNTFCPNETRRIEREDGLLTARSVKLFADGALGSWGAALIEPYSDDPTSSGTLLIPGEDMVKVATEWFKFGYQVNIHAIGDLANRWAIRSHAAALGTACPSNSMECLAKEQSMRRNRIEHTQIVHPDDQKIMHALGIVPSIQPTHATSDSRYAEDRLGPVRTRNSAYCMKSLLPLPLCLGSDFPVESPDIVAGIRAAVERKGWEGKVFGPEERLSFWEALRGFTRGPAYAGNLEETVGSVEKGKWADWVVVDKVGLDMSVQETWSAGKNVFRKAGGASVEEAASELKN